MWVRLHERGDHLGERFVEIRGHRNADLAANHTLLGAHAGLCLPHGVQGDSRLAIERLASVGQREAPRRAAEQAGPQFLLETGEPPPDRGPRNAQLGCRARQGLRIDSAGEGEQLRDFDRLSGLDHL
jgi:hypothetical protein